MMYHVIAFHPSARDMGVFFDLIPPFFSNLKKRYPQNAFNRPTSAESKAQGEAI